MSEPTRKLLTKREARLKQEIRAKLARVTSTEDLMTLNKVIDKYLPPEPKNATPTEVFGDDWVDRAKKLGRVIQGLRFREGLSQVELARELRGVKQSNISAWETGKEKVPRKRLEQLSKLFNMDLFKLRD
ncbi:MAG: multiprotein-bridging factor 1 family protein [Bacteriovoracia bacterium]